MPAPKRPKLTPEEQHAQFVETARQIGADESEAAFNEKLGKVARVKVPEVEPSQPKRNHAAGKAR